MEGNDYSEEYEVDEEKKKFRITRGMVILAALVLIAIIVIIIVVAKSKSNKQEYTTDDFKLLEQRMEEEASSFIEQNKLELTGDPIRIDLVDLLLENGGSIDSQKVKATRICEGYVLAYDADGANYDSYIRCENKYMTPGYESNDEEETTTTTTKAKDTEKPVITLKGNQEITINQNSKYIEEGATAMDNIDGDITAKIKTSGKVDTETTGTYTVTYTVTDKAGNKAEISRNVIVVSVPIVTTTTKRTTVAKSSSGGVKTTVQTTKILTPPTLTLNGAAYVEVNSGTTYKDDGYSARDAKGNDLTSRVNVSGTVNTGVAGTYTLIFSVTDDYGKTTTKTRTIKVKDSYVKVQSVTVYPNSITMSKGSTKSVNVTVNPSNATNKSVSWSSSNASVATAANGVITANASGSATITVTAADGQKASIFVSVK